MRKKDIQQLNDAMLENVEVPDSVLDMAREQMRASALDAGPASVSTPAKKQKRTRRGAVRGRAIAVNRKAAAAVCACTVIAVIAVVVFVSSLNRGTFNSSYNGNSYNLSELTASDITSVSDYNAENGTTYLSFEDENTSTVLYSDGDTPVLFAESFNCDGTDCIWYIVVNENDYVDILDTYSDLYNSSVIADCDVYYSSDGGGQYAKFIFGESKYYVYAEADGENILDILTRILT